MKILTRIDKKRINFDSFRYIIIRNKFCEKQSLNSMLL